MALAFGMYGILLGKREYTCIDTCIFSLIVLIVSYFEIDIGARIDVNSGLERMVLSSFFNFGFFG